MTPDPFDGSGKASTPCATMKCPTGAKEMMAEEM
jgi:hypothetical protein